MVPEEERTVGDVTYSEDFEFDLPLREPTQPDFQVEVVGSDSEEEGGEDEEEDLIEAFGQR